jgi:hypothetical protein
MRTSPEMPPTRVMIEFSTAVNGDSAGLLASLTATGAASITYLSAVSPTTHAYRLSCTPDDLRCERALLAIAVRADVISVTPDEMKTRP